MTRQHLRPPRPRPREPRRLPQSRRWRGRSSQTGVTCGLGWLVALLCAATPLFAQSDSTLRIHFFEVGQGDASLIESPTGRRVLIDAGPAGNKIVARLKALGV